MKYISMILAVLLVASLMVVTVGAIHTEELESEVVDPLGHVYEFSILLVSHEELPHHTELSPFFRENDLIEFDREESDEIPKTVTEWFQNTDDNFPIPTEEIPEVTSGT